MADFLDRNDTAKAGGVTVARDIISAPSYLRWLGEGKVFEAGFGLEDAEENSSDGADDTTATFGLIAPSGSTTYVMPLYLRLSCTSDGGALSNWCITFTRPAADCATTLAVSGGTAFPFKRNMNREFSTQGEARAEYGDALTCSALTNADYVGAVYGHAIDAVLTSGLVAVGGASNEIGFNFMGGDCGLPHILTKGAAMIVYIFTGTSDSVWRGYMQWAELSSNDLY